MATYYVKNVGDDEKDGTSDANAWATINKVNSVAFSAGDSILFNRGDTWRERLVCDNNGSSGNWITYGAYGSGNIPKIMRSLNKSTTGDWSDQGSNIWRCYDAAFNTYGNDVGNLVLNGGPTCGVRVQTSGEVNAQGKFWYDTTNHWVHLYSTSNPGTYYTDIECCMNHNPVQFRANYIVLENIAPGYCGLHALDIYGASGINNLIIRGCHLSYVGGSQLYAGMRHGNGFQMWENVNNVWIYKNIIEHCYDAGIAPQGNTGEIYNIWMYNNLLKNSEYNVELFHGGNMHDIYIENNTFRDGGDGWSHNQRWDSKRGCHIWLADFNAYSNNYCRNNIFYRTPYSDVDTYGAAIVFTHSDHPNYMAFDYNQFYEESTSHRIYQMEYDAETKWYYTGASFAAWKAAYPGQDTHSALGDPLFQGGEEIELESNSPCKDAGVTTENVTDDYYETTRPQGLAYDIGAYEYDSQAGLFVSCKKIVLV